LALDPEIGDGSTIPNVARLRDESGLSLELVATTRINAPDLSASYKLVSDQAGVPGQILTYTLVLRNDGLQPSTATLVDAVPLGLSYPVGPAWASSGRLTLTESSLLWTGLVLEGQPVTITLPATIGPGAIGRYLHNRANMSDGWGVSTPIETHTWVEMRLYLPMVLSTHRMPVRQSQP
jgi:uncharacterized repeat protein (TIGR01451 family)